MPNHASLTGADLHEPKGVAGASVDTVYVADGAGSGDWEKLSAGIIDTTTIFNINKFYVSTFLTDVSTPSSVYFPVPQDSNLEAVHVTLQAAITVADSLLTFRNNGGTSMGTGTVEFLGSGAGTTFTFNTFSPQAFLAGQRMQIETDGGSTTASGLWIVCEFTQT